MDNWVSRSFDDRPSDSQLSRSKDKIRKEPTLGEFSERFGDLLVLDEYPTGASSAGNQTLVSDVRRVSETRPNRNENLPVSGGGNVCNVYSNREQQQEAASVAGQGTADSSYLLVPRTSGVERDLSTRERDFPREWRPQQEAVVVAGQGTADLFSLLGPRTSGIERDLSTRERDFPREWRPQQEAGDIAGQGTVDSSYLLGPRTSVVERDLSTRERDFLRQWRPQHEAGDIAGQGTADSSYLLGPRTSVVERDLSTRERDFPLEWRPQQEAGDITGQGTADSSYLLGPRTSGIERDLSTRDRDFPLEWRPQQEAVVVAGQGTADPFSLLGLRTSGIERDLSTRDRDFPREWRPRQEAVDVSGQREAECFSLLRPKTSGVEVNNALPPDNEFSPEWRPQQEAEALSGALRADESFINRSRVADDCQAQMKRNTPGEGELQQEAAYYGNLLRENRSSRQGETVSRVSQGHPGVCNANKTMCMPSPIRSIRGERDMGAAQKTSPAGYPNSSHIAVIEQMSDGRYMSLPVLGDSGRRGQSSLSRGCEQLPCTPLKYPQRNYTNVGLNDNNNGVPSLHEVEFQKRESSGRHPSRLRGKETRPPPYDGTGDWHDYAIQFELISELNGWDLITKGMQLATSLRGNALAVLGDLDSHKRRNYESLVDALTRRFGSKNQTELHRVELKNKQRKKGETLPELAQSVRRLSKLAYPDAKNDLQETLARDHFIDALADSDLRWGIYQSRPRCLNDAVKTAIEFEAFRKAENQRNINKGKFVRTVSGLPREKSPEKQVEPIAENFKHVVETMMGAIKQGFENIQKDIGKANAADKKPAKKGRARKGDDYDKCYNCKETGHFARDCPKPKPEEPAASKNVQEN
ncbi:hypothetical protein HOLleu_18984 [Holothuria leucospilota]|uniref:CCHC-type domain-containing protein n=1 Tax=Holothuria leucospilota TaxID=206669 RepID=A0A9Q1C4J6_HOLLE|nr:hypothetical protein HOLleu_18984 [Holothuria leucospilota]